MDAPRNRRVPRFPRVSVAHANSSSLVRAHSFLTGGTATEQGWHRCRRRRDRVGIASREAPYSLSIIIDLGRELLGLLGPVHSYETSLPSLTTSLIINCISARLNCNGTFQCRSINEPPQSPKSVVRRVRTGFAQLGVSRRGCGFVVCASRSLRGAKKHRTAALFCVSVASHLPARVAIVGLICAMASAALPASDRRNSTSVISRLARGGCWVVIKKKVRFLLRCASA